MHKSNCSDMYMKILLYMLHNEWQQDVPDNSMKNMALFEYWLVLSDFRLLLEHGRMCDKFSFNRQNHGDHAAVCDSPPKLPCGLPLCLHVCSVEFKVLCQIWLLSTSKCAVKSIRIREDAVVSYRLLQFRLPTPQNFLSVFYPHYVMYVHIVSYGQYDLYCPYKKRTFPE